MRFDLHYSIAGVTPISQAGMEYLAAGCPSYADATARGLHVSFEDKEVLQDITRDPSSTSMPYKPIDWPDDMPGFQEGDSTLGIPGVAGDPEGPIGTDDDSEDIESEASGY
jgi:hypothetical protein